MIRRPLKTREKNVGLFSWRRKFNRGLTLCQLLILIAGAPCELRVARVIRMSQTRSVAATSMRAA
jgi:hypothetical protein